MNESTPLVIRPLPHQREFIESDERSMVFEGGGGAGKTHALFLAAVRDLFLPGFRGLLVHPSFRGFTPFLEKWVFFAMEMGLSIWQSDSTTVILKSNGRLEFSTSVFHTKSFDFIGVDDVDECTASGVQSLLGQLKPHGRFRATRSDTMSKLLGRVVSRHDVPNPHLDPDYVARVTGPKGEP